MQKCFRLFFKAFILSASIGSPILSIAAQEGENMNKQTNLQASAEAAKKWLSIVDKGSYGQSWDQASALMKLTIHKDEWEKVMDAMRKPLGSVKTREVIDQRTAQNPKGLPSGDYMVMFYKTAFSQRPNASELVTLHLEDGVWSVMTYQVN